MLKAWTAMNVTNSGNAVVFLMFRGYYKQRAKAWSRFGPACEDLSKAELLLGFPWSRLGFFSGRFPHSSTASERLWAGKPLLNVCVCGRSCFFLLRSGLCSTENWPLRTKKEERGVRRGIFALPGHLFSWLEKCTFFLAAARSSHRFSQKHIQKKQAKILLFCWRESILTNMSYSSSNVRQLLTDMSYYILYRHDVLSLLKHPTIILDALGKWAQNDIQTDAWKKSNCHKGFSSQRKSALKVFMCLLGQRI